jgi:FkbM family methyltransferase
METNIVQVKDCLFEVRDHQEKIQKLWLNGSFYESQKNGLLSYLSRHKYSGRVLEIGASIGNHAVYYAKILGCEVTAIEPAPSSYDHLIKNLELNNIEAITHNVALGMQRQKVSMVNISQQSNVGMYNVAPGNEVDMFKLDTLIKGQYDFVKIDVENYNTELLFGASDFFTSQDKCHVFIECESKQALAETDWIMYKYGYTQVPEVILNHTPTYLWKK